VSAEHRGRVDERVGKWCGVVGEASALGRRIGSGERKAPQERRERKVVREWRKR